MNQQEVDHPIKGELYSVERLEDYATYLAGQLSITLHPKVTQLLLPRMKDNGIKLLASYRSLTEAIHRRESLPPAAEWLTDNFHIVEDQLREIQEDLPPAYYSELPKLALGKLAGYPRIYALALALVAHTDSQLDPDTIKRFINSYQKVTPLKIGELWALAITLRLVLVENLRRISVEIVSSHEQRIRANEFADQLLKSVADQTDSSEHISALWALSCNKIEDDCTYLAQISKRLRDQGMGILPALESLEKLLAQKQSTPEHVVHLSHQLQASNQVTVANVITSMRLLSNLNWRDFFESISIIDRVLEKDPVYQKMDFSTRDRYRHVIETISKRTRASEIDIAEQSVSLALGDPFDKQKRHSHVGYFLIGPGRSQLGAIFKFKTWSSFQEYCVLRPNLIYFGLFGFLWALICLIPIAYSNSHAVSSFSLWGIGLLIAIPSSDLALSFTHLILTHLIRPNLLPKLDFSTGIPRHGRTMVVIPSMLSGEPVIQELLEKLEIHYLGNNDPQIFFALLTDWMDASTQSTHDDHLRLSQVTDGILALNQKYPSPNEDRFYLFHRQRSWNSSENSWIGWERKRGKIDEFNRLLRGATDTTFLSEIPPKDFLGSISYVITLDADTQLPRDTAHKLVGTLMHPLNEPHFDKDLGRVTHGYGILQPRMGVSLESASRSPFSKLFSGFTGIDPYTTAVSEVYQDLFGEGSYTGKGLYHVDTFQAALAHRIPENTVLSHDLFEGLYSRTGLITDVELLDDFPKTYRSYFMRAHRWTRGDWQIASWILPYVRNDKNQWTSNRLPLISRWKIFDNLRRSLVAPSLFACIVLGWAVLPGSPLFWSLFGLLIIALPIIVLVALDAAIQNLGKKSTRWTNKSRANQSNLLQAILYFTFLPHLGYIQSDAILRVLYRKWVSKKHLLEWTPAASTEADSRKFKILSWQSYVPLELLLATLSGSLYALASSSLLNVMPIMGIWACAPLVAHLMSRSSKRKIRTLDLDGKRLFREIARRTWHYFETYVTSNDHFLPPDNHQIDPQAMTAHRTSPTNIGLYLLSLASARDLGYVNTPNFLKRLGSTLSSLEKLEQYQGHYLNWYDTQTLEPLSPKYVSTVDSGNIAGYFLAVRQTCLSVPDACLIDPRLLEGLLDVLCVIERELITNGSKESSIATSLSHCRNLIDEPHNDTLSGWTQKLKSLMQSFQDLKQKVVTRDLANPNESLALISHWVGLGIDQIEDNLSELLIVAPELNELLFQVGGDLSASSPSHLQLLTELIHTVDQNPSLRELLKSFNQSIEVLQSLPPSLMAKVSRLTLTLQSAEAHIGRQLAEAHSAAESINQKFESMNFSFLLDKTRGVFSIGYNVTNGTTDPGLYDLLGSESRLASFIAIAKGDVLQEHWFRLGRQLVPIGSDRALLSWTASMFEYLMPLLVMRDYENTLLDETAHSIVARQIKYGNENSVPWGISEAGYHARDLQLNYQYGPFGIPGLGLKRGLSHDLVISPYSSLLAAQIDPTAALSNLKRLIDNRLLTPFGFYESVDYTAERLPENSKFAIIKSFMAHHQGMSLVAINNVVNGNIIQDRFHADPRVRATRLLLQERIPRGVVPVLPKAAEIELEGKEQSKISPLIRTYPDPGHSSPRIQLLSNQTYSVMISTAGGGYSKCGDAAVTRWQEDATRDHWGSYIFIQDRTQSATWSTSYHPFAVLPQDYKVTFSEEKVEFRRRDGDISTYTQIVVAPEANVEIRHVTLTNSSTEPRVLELTSYLEPVLGPASNDLDHLAFSKLFIQTEFLASQKALLAHRRKRSPLDQENWGFHVVVTDGEVLSEVQYETDRTHFIGRGKTLAHARVLSDHANLTNTAGSTLDPCLSLRIKVQVPPLGKIHVAFTTGLASTREQALELTDRFHDIHSFERESTLAWTKSQVDMRHLNIDAESAYLYQRLAERIIYLDPILRTPAHQRATHTNVQSSLWPLGIGGDLPIMVIRIGKEKDIAIVHKLLRCHEYLRLKGLVYEFVIINENETTYLQNLQDDLLNLIRTTGCQGWLAKAGGVFVLRRAVTPIKDIAHILSVARVVLNADEPLKDQINRKSLIEKYPEPLSFGVKRRDIPLPRQPQPSDPHLTFFNGTGGFTADGREYVIHLQPGQWPPAPWINVIGNCNDFGFQISESGSGFTWSINSQSNRLTPWSNDPVSDPSGEMIYLRDEDTGQLWSPTPLPIRSDAPYTIRHGHGYTQFENTSHGISHELTLFVPKQDSVKLSILKLKNLSQKKRRLTLTYYVEWVLGTQRTKTSPYLVCDLDPETQAIFAINPHDDDFSNRVAFADTSEAQRTFTCSRREFIGRNGNTENPEALRRKGLSGKTGTGQDPCSAIQSSIELEPGEEREVVFLLGQSSSVDEARKLTLKYRALKTAREALTEVSESWTDLLGTIQVKTPDSALDIVMNGWLPYQILSCRYWSRTALYQSGGAYGFRDQLQDCMALVYSAPHLTREHLLRAAARQFNEGDVQHWWHPPRGRGVRTRISDDLLWLPFVVSHYIDITGDHSVLAEEVPFLEAPLLKPHEEDAYSLPWQSSQSGSIFEHCRRAIEHSLLLGTHGLPLMGTGDWNDGMNRVGSQGTGESIWLGWFLYKVLADFMPHCEQPTQEKYKAHMAKLKEALESEGWDGAWYRRAYFDDGTPLGSTLSEECKMDSIAQSWAVISGAGDPVRAQLAMKSVSDFLIRRDSQLILLLTPPFEKTAKNPGYIQGYVPGVRENGGQYTHAATWVMMAFAELGDGNQAMEVFNMLNPIRHSLTPEASSKYKTEPYALAGDVYAGQTYEGRGGWSWYTGSASWYYRVGLENLLGFRQKKDILTLSPCIPTEWKEFEINYNYGKSKYLIKVLNPHALCKGNVQIEMDGHLFDRPEIPLIDDGRTRKLTATLLKPKQLEYRADQTDSDPLKH